MNIRALVLTFGSALLAAPCALARPAASDDTAIRPFRVNIPQAALDDLRQRLVATRWPDKETVADGSQGPQLAKLQETGSATGAPATTGARRKRSSTPCRSS